LKSVGKSGQPGAKLAGAILIKSRQRYIRGNVYSPMQQYGIWDGVVEVSSGLLKHVSPRGFLSGLPIDAVFRIDLSNLTERTNSVTSGSNSGAHVRS
jgi:hypothetical protein